MVDFLHTGPKSAEAFLLLAHGAGAPMDSPYMNMISAALGGRGIRVSRFEFAYMAARRQGQRKSPPRAERAVGEFKEAIASLARAPLFIGGKSYGGRVASLAADDLYAQGAIAGLICLGYPFHPPAKPEALRTAHLEAMATPTLICQGTRDPFGKAQEIPSYHLADTIAIHWLEDGDHDFKPRKASGFTHAAHLESVADQIAIWIDSVLAASN